MQVTFTEKKPINNSKMKWKKRKISKIKIKEVIVIKVNQYLKFLIFLEYNNNINFKGIKSNEELDR